MNSSAFVNRIEVLLYSTLTSAMSGLNHLKSLVQHQAPLPAEPFPAMDAEPLIIDDQNPEAAAPSIWKTFTDAIPPLLLWLVLGFAAGFLIGMIKPW